MGTLSSLFGLEGCALVEKEEGVFIPKDLIYLPHEDSPEPEVEFFCIGGHFKKKFLSNGIDVGPISEKEINFYDSEVLQNDGDDLSLRGLWEVENAINCRDLYCLLRKQKRGDHDGCLLVNGYRNLFCVTDLLGDVCVVTLYYQHGWHIISREVSNTKNSDYAGYPVRVFSAKKLF